MRPPAAPPPRRSGADKRPIKWAWPLNVLRASASSDCELRQNFMYIFACLMGQVPVGLDSSDCMHSQYFNHSFCRNFGNIKALLAVVCLRLQPKCGVVCGKFSGSKRPDTCAEPGRARNETDGRSQDGSQRPEGTWASCLERRSSAEALPPAGSGMFVGSLDDGHYDVLYGACYTLRIEV
jgi:hypothetical protein